MLEYFAERDRTAVSVVLTRELDASAHSPELTSVIPGFGVALAWPDGQDVRLVC